MMPNQDKKIKPELPSGFKDYLPEEMIPRQAMLDTIRAVFENFGFSPLDTPTIEREEVLTGGDADFNKQIFKIAARKEDKDSSNLALRFDLTIPLARVFASNLNLSRPFKRYQISKAFRAEHAQMGRFREFVQCDADIVGSGSAMADAEIISLLYNALSALKLKNFTIKIGSRKILAALIKELSPKGDADSILRAIDKLDKIGWEGVEKELKALKSGIDIEDLKRALTKDILTGGLVAQYPNSQELKDGIEEIIQVLDHMEALNVLRDNYVVDLSIARGLGYYTGIVFETVLNDLPGIGSVASGGRYDGLIERFSKDQVPAVGVSIGVDRLFTALVKLGAIKPAQRLTEVLILNFDKSSAEKVQKMATMLRLENINTEIYLGSEDSFKGQLAYAVKQEFPIVVIIGPREMVGSTIQIKDMRSREQFEVPEVGLLKKIQELIHRK